MEQPEKEERELVLYIIRGNGQEALEKYTALTIPSEKLKSKYVFQGAEPIIEHLIKHDPQKLKVNAIPEFMLEGFLAKRNIRPNPHRLLPTGYGKFTLQQMFAKIKELYQNEVILPFFHGKGFILITTTERYGGDDIVKPQLINIEAITNVEQEIYESAPYEYTLIHLVNGRTLKTETEFIEVLTAIKNSSS